jgi:hypothetical protein
VILNGEIVVHERDFSRRVAIIEKLVRLRPTNTLIIRLAGRPGDRFTLSLLGTPVRPSPISLTPNPLRLMLGSEGNLLATLRPAPPAPGVLTIQSSQPSIASVPPTVAFATGQTTVPIGVKAVGVGTAQVTVALNGKSISSTVKVTGTPPTITSLVPNRLPITQGATGALTVTMSAAQPLIPRLQ